MSSSLNHVEQPLDEPSSQGFPVKGGGQAAAVRRGNSWWKWGIAVAAIGVFGAVGAVLATQLFGNDSDSSASNYQSTSNDSGTIGDETSDTNEGEGADMDGGGTETPLMSGYETSYLSGSQTREPTWDDWLFIKSYWFDRIDDSTCPPEGSADLKTHWDYNYQDFINAGMSEQEALSQDCTLFARERNPRQMGSSLVRNAFHDSVGGMDGFVNVHDLDENGGLFAPQKTLRDAYASLELPNDADVFGGETTPVSEVLSLADFSAWAGHAALVRAAQAVAGNANTIDCADPNNPNDGNCDIVPDIPVRWGRLSYINVTVEEAGPREFFPRSGPAGSGESMVRYFRDEFGFTERETVSMLGIHTFGGARRSASGYAGMWTQSKNRLNNDYQRQLIFPLPFSCAHDPTGGGCVYFSEAGDDITDNVGMTTCLDAHLGRCHGWEQVRIAGFEGNSPKFQWRHSCLADGTGCNHMMLNIDMGMYRHLNGYICTDMDEQRGVMGTLGRRCVEGMIKDYPPNSSCERATSRVLATCFQEDATRGGYIEEDASNFQGWMEDFAPLFDRLLTHRLYGSPTLQTLGEPERR